MIDVLGRRGAAENHGGEGLQRSDRPLLGMSQKRRQKHHHDDTHKDGSTRQSQWNQDNFGRIELLQVLSSWTMVWLCERRYRVVVRRRSRGVP